MKAHIFCHAKKCKERKNKLFGAKNRKNCWWHKWNEICKLRKGEIFITSSLCELLQHVKCRILSSTIVPLRSPEKCCIGKFDFVKLWKSHKKSTSLFMISRISILDPTTTPQSSSVHLWISKFCKKFLLTYFYLIFWHKILFKHLWRRKYFSLFYVRSSCHHRCTSLREWNRCLCCAKSIKLNYKINK